MKGVKNKILCLAMIGVLTITMIPFAVSSEPVSNSIKIFPPSSKPYGISFSEHIQNYWKWLLNIPANGNPVNDPTGEKCTTGQLTTNSSIFYLVSNGGGKSDRTCKVPAGKGLFIPVSQVEISDKEDNGGIQAQDMGAKEDQDSVNSLYLKIDGREYKYENLTKFRTHTEPFEVIFANNGLYSVVKGGPSMTVADGHYIITEPLAKGNHTIQFRNSLLEADKGVSVVQDLHYNITAE